MKIEDFSKSDRIFALQIFNELLQNEQQKAANAAGSFMSGRRFGGTSVTSLIARPDLKDSLIPRGYDELADTIAECYKNESDKIFSELSKAFTEKEIKLFKDHGIFYGFHVSPKLLALSEGLYVDKSQLLIEGFPDPYELPKQDKETIRQYFTELHRQKGLKLDLSSLVLADTTTPHGFEGKKILNPSDMNEKLVDLSIRVTKALSSKMGHVDPLYALSTDTDSPHRILLAENKRPLQGYPLTPGLTMCGSTATMEGFDFKYAYRMGLIAQSLSTNIVSSKMEKEFHPFVFFGMLSPFGYSNGAIPVGKMGDLRYPGNIDLKREFDFILEEEVSRLM